MKHCDMLHKVNVLLHFKLTTSGMHLMHASWLTVDYEH